MKTQIIIPMSGFGERFRRAGYDVPKPLIEIEGKPIIAHVIDMFKGETDFIFICNENHLKDENFQMESILKKYCPTGKIIGIPAHKLGPIFAVTKINDLIDNSNPVVVNYCDFTCYWDWDHFVEFTQKTNCDGAIPAYKGFHPHSLGKTNYAYIKQENGWLEDIQEKKPFTKNRINEFASSGTYYFKTGKIMKDSFEYVIKNNIHVGNEFYVSLAYKYLLEKNLNIATYPLQHFMQWGTPDDVDEYNNWSNTFKNILLKKYENKSLVGKNESNIIAMAGLGKRFYDEGYKKVKPMIEVSGKPMVLQATNDLPRSKSNTYVLRSDMENYNKIIEDIRKADPSASFKILDGVTNGQASTAQIGLEYLEEFSNKKLGPITFGACDSGFLYDFDSYNKLINDEDVDVIVWATRGNINAIRRPEMFGWIMEIESKISKISVKKPLEDPKNDPMVIGTFTYKKAEDFKKSLACLKARKGSINNEFYIDSCINDSISLGLNCHILEVSNYLSWGTPNDLKTFEYWQSCFHKWHEHPYKLEKDSRVDKFSIASLEEKYKKSVPDILKPKD
jgi:NDP-sugar pyrophosphorylase family protein